MTTPAPQPQTATPRATSYVWRLLLLVPAILLAAYGYWRYIDVPPGGTVLAIRLSSKTDLSGQVRDAYEGIAPATSDFYLVIACRGRDPLSLKPYNDTPLGNGLTWTLDAPLPLAEIARIEVWDHNTLLKDKALDRIELPGDVWAGDGQTFHVTLSGTHAEPPIWALPLMAVGATLGAVVVLRFVWDQAI